MKSSRHNCFRGFTLIEIMIAIGIFSLVVAAIYACWSAVLRSSKVGLDAAARAQRSRMALQCVEEALTYSKMHSVNADLYWFQGESGSDAILSFVAKLPRSFPRGAKFGDMTLRRVEFSLQPGKDDASQLVLRQAPLLEDFDEDEQNYPLVLEKNVEKMEIRFWDSEQGDWINTWEATNEIPAMVQISLVTKRELERNEIRQESTILVSPAAHAVQAESQAPAPPPPSNPNQPPADGQQNTPPPGQQFQRGPGGAGNRLPIITR